ELNTSTMLDKEFNLTKKTSSLTHRFYQNTGTIVNLPKTKSDVNLNKPTMRHLKDYVNIKNNQHVEEHIENVAQQQSFLSKMLLPLMYHSYWIQNRDLLIQGHGTKLHILNQFLFMLLKEDAKR